MTTRDGARSYTSDTIAVHWQPARCIHTGNCIRGLPAVFAPGDRPWVHIDEASVDQIAEVVRNCPTGALHYQRLDGGPDETPDAPRVTAARNGPLYVRGDIEVVDADGRLLRKDTRVALCRCGQSANKPFCDNTHRAIGFRA